MIYDANLPETDPGIILACNQFAAQITPLLPMDGMAIVLLEPGGSTSRVVYSWFNPAVSDQFLASRVGTASTPPQRRRPSLRISLNGQEGLLGEVLIRGCKPGDYGQSPEGLVGRCADQLALALENIELRRRLNSNQEVNSAVRRVARAATPGVPIRRVFLRFATEVEALAGIPQIKPTFLDIAPSGIPSNIIPHSKGIKCGLIRSNSPFSYSNHRPAKPKIPKPLVYAQVSPLGTSFATP